MNERSDTIFLTAALVLLVGVPVALYSIFYFAESVELILTAILLMMVLVSVVNIIVVRHKDHMISYLLRVPTQFVRDISRPLSRSVTLFVEGKTSEGNDKLEEFLRSVIAHYAWIQTRRWIVGSSMALLVGFAGLLGSVLLKQQNNLIVEQNTFFREQIDQQQLQIELQQEVNNQTIRSEAIRRIYGHEYRNQPRVKAEAVRSLVSVERIRISEGRNTLPTDYINLHDADLSSAWLDSADLRKVSFRGSKLHKTNFNSADLKDSVFRYSDLTGATLMAAEANDVHIALSNAEEGVFLDAELVGSNFNQSNLRRAKFGGADVFDATFYKVNLEGADLRGLENWEMISTIEGSNIFGVQNAPDGFERWALENGAVSEAGALSDLWEEAQKRRVSEETGT